ncbi:branched-chain amino acid ABC transporter permease [Dactylosporangium sp. CS-033363]|uniref:branched-chain amino acid ABC transporter permease n=1 Tax=Dactylosporangium sp. CS-033363 TaxID=3239935 RepID=UPI003D8A7331
MSVSEIAAPGKTTGVTAGLIWRHRRRADRTRLVQIAVVTAVLALLPLFAGNDYQLTVLGLLLIYTIAGIGFYVILGLSGQFAFSHAATMGIGAYCAAYAARTQGFWVSLLFAVAVCAVLAAVVKLLLWRASDFYFGIATLGLASVTIITFRAWESFTGPASNAVMVTVPTVFGAEVTTPGDYYWLFLAFFVAGMLVVHRLRASALHRESIAVRDKPLTAAGLGIHNTRNQLVVFVVGSCYAAVAGALYAQSQGFISSPSFDLNLGINLFVVVIVGGMQSMWGPLLGAAFVIVLPELIRPAQNHRQLILAAVLVLTIVLLPEGLMGLAAPIRRAAARLRPRRDPEGGRP